MRYSLDHKHMSQKGFTLIEVIIVVVVFGIVAYIGGMILQQGFRAASLGQSIIDAESQGLVASERVSRDLRLIRSAVDITTATASRITFVSVDGSSVDYSSDVVSGVNQLLRNGNVLANASLAFSYYDADGNDITSSVIVSNIRYIKFTVGVAAKSGNILLSTVVNPRNLP